MPSSEALLRHLKTGDTFRREGDEIVFACQSSSASVEFCGGKSWATTRIPDTGRWALVVRIPEFNRAVISYQFMTSKGDDIKMGPAAPHRIVWREWVPDELLRRSENKFDFGK